MSVRTSNVRSNRGMQMRKASRQRQIVKAVIASIVVIATVIAGYTIYTKVIASKGSDNVSSSQAENERNAALKIDKTPVTDKDKDSYKVSNDKPRFMFADSIGLSRARVKEVGLSSANSDGSQQMEAPTSIYDVGWFNCLNDPVTKTRCSNYTAPGSSSTKTAAVIDGHSCQGKGCVFDKLGDLEKGDEVRIEMGNGKTYTYKVVKNETVKLEDLDMNKVMKPATNRPGLNMITCDGSWKARDSRGVRTMDHRTVVYTELVSSN